MCKNTIQFQKGLGIMQFLANYGSEEQCERALFAWRWPEGFRCPNCGSCKFCKLHRKAEYHCNRCRCQTSLTSNTIFDSWQLSGFVQVDDAYTGVENGMAVVGEEVQRTSLLL